MLNTGDTPNPEVAFLFFYGLDGWDQLAPVILDSIPLLLWARWDWEGLVFILHTWRVRQQVRNHVLIIGRLNHQQWGLNKMSIVWGISAATPAFSLFVAFLDWEWIVFILHFPKDLPKVGIDFPQSILFWEWIAIVGQKYPTVWKPKDFGGFGMVI